MRRGNIRIVGVDEQPGSTSPKAVSKLKVALKMDRDIKITPQSCVNQASRPQVIIAKLHYDGDTAEILRRARDSAPLSHH